MNNHAFKQITNAISMLKHRFISHHYTCGHEMPDDDLFHSIDTFCVAALISTFSSNNVIDDSEYYTLETLIKSFNFKYPRHVDNMDPTAIIRWASDEVSQVPYFLVYAVSQELTSQTYMVDEVQWMIKQILVAAYCIDGRLDPAEVGHIRKIGELHRDYIRGRGLASCSNNWDFPSIVVGELSVCD